MDDDRNDQPLDNEETTRDRRDEQIIVDDRRGNLQEHRADDGHLSEVEVARLRTMLNDGSLDDGVSRFKWFLLGFLAALVALIVAAGAFLVVSDDDDDGRLDLEVPEVDVGG